MKARPDPIDLLFLAVGGSVSSLVLAGAARSLSATGEGPHGPIPFLCAAMVATLTGALGARAASRGATRVGRRARVVLALASGSMAATGLLGLFQASVAARGVTLLSRWSIPGLEPSVVTFAGDVLLPALLTGVPIATAALLQGLLSSPPARSAGRTAGFLLFGAAAGVLLHVWGPPARAPREAVPLPLFPSVLLLLLSLITPALIRRISGPPTSDPGDRLDGWRRATRRSDSSHRWGTGLALVAAGGGCVLLLAALGRVVSLTTGDGSRARLSFTLVILAAGGIGAALAPRALRRAPGPWRLLGACVALVGLIGLFVELSADMLPSAYLGLLARAGLTSSGEWGAVASVEALAILGPALFAGAALAIAGELLGAPMAAAAAAAGAGLGSLLLSALVTGIGLQGTLSVAGVILSVSGGLLVFLEEGARWWRAARSLVLLLLCAILLWSIEPWDRRLLTSGVSQSPFLFLDGGESRLLERVRHDRILAYREAPARTAGVKLVEGRLPVLFLDGAVTPLGGLDMQRAQRLAGHLGALLGPARGRALVLAAGAPATIDALRRHAAFEIEVASGDGGAGMMILSPSFLFMGAGSPSILGEAELAGEGADAVRRPPRVLAADATRALAADRAAGAGYDLIIAPPLVREEEIVGLFQPEELRLIRSRLNPGGWVCLAVPLRGLTPEGVREAVVSFGEVFPAATLWSAGSELILLSGGEEGGMDLGRVGPRSRRPSVAASLGAIGLDDPLKILALRIASLAETPGLAGPSVPRAEREDLPRGATEDLLRSAALGARLRPQLKENLDQLLSWMDAGKLGGHFPEWWTAEAREAVVRRLAILRDVERQVLTAHAALSAGDLAGALAAATAALNLDPGDLAARSLGARALSTRAERALARGDRSAAAEDDISALGMDPASVEALTSLAWIRRDEGRAESAEELLRRAIASAPEAALLHYRLGLLRLDAGDLQDAEAALTRAFDLDPRQPEPLLALGDIAKRREHPAEALELYMKALSLGGREAETRTALASLHLEAGRPEDAARELETALRAKPGDPEALLTRALLRAGLGEREGARQDLLSAVTTGGVPYRARAMRIDMLRELLDETPRKGRRAAPKL